MPSKFTTVREWLLASLVASSQLCFAQDVQTSLDISSSSCYASLIEGISSQFQTNCRKLSKEISASPFDIHRLKAQTTYSVYQSMLGNSEIASKDLKIAISKIKPQDSDKQLSIALSQAHSTLGNIYISRKEFKNAGKSISESLILAKALNNNALMLDSLSSLSLISLATNDTPRALKYAYDTVFFAETLEPSSIDPYGRTMFTVFRSLLNAQEASGSFDLAIISALKAVEFAEASFPQNSSLRAAIYSDIARLYLHTKEYDLAEKYFLLSTARLDDPDYTLTREVSNSIVSYLQLFAETSRVQAGELFLERSSFKILSSPESAEKIKMLGSIGIFYMKNTKQTKIARDYIVKAAILSNKLFGPSSQTTNQLAELAESAELNP